MTKKRIMACAVAMLIGLPLVLIMDEPSNGLPSVWNFIGIIYLTFLVFGGWKFITPKWVRKELEPMFDDNDC